MTEAQEANAYVNALTEWAQNSGGVVTYVPTVSELWVQAYITSDKPRVLFCYVGEIARGPFSRAAATHRVDRQWLAAVTRGRGVSANRGDAWTQTVGNSPPFLDVFATVREAIRAINNTSAEVPLDYKATKTVSQKGDTLDGLVIEFSTAHDLPALAATPTNNEPI